MAAGLALGGCAAAGPSLGPDAGPVAGATYEGVQTLLLADDMVSVRAAMRGGRGAADVERYAACAAAQYALIRGQGFARHVRTLLDESGGLWRADAVYVISAALPAGSRTIDAEVTVAECGQSGIPTV